MAQRRTSNHWDMLSSNLNVFPNLHGKLHLCYYWKGRDQSRHYSAVHWHNQHWKKNESVLRKSWIAIWSWCRSENLFTKSVAIYRFKIFWTYLPDESWHPIRVPNFLLPSFPPCCSMELVEPDYLTLGSKFRWIPSQ